MMLSVGSRKKILNYIQEIVTRRCHHENVNYIMVVQDLIFLTNKFRMLFSNANYIVIFPNKGDNRNIKHVLRSRGYNSKDCEKLLKLAFDDCEDSHPHLLMDNTHDVVDNGRLRQGIFNDSNLYIFEKK